MSNNLVKDKDYEVLIVEDEVVLALSMEIKLKKLGFLVSGICTTYEDAILHARNKQPHLILMDINLSSEKTGIDAANYIWRNFNIPIIFLTSYYNDKVLNSAMESEPYGYLIKPCRDSELKATINTALHKHQFFFKNIESLKIQNQDFIYISDSLKYDKGISELYLENKIVKLTKNEKKIFDLLAKYPKQIISFTSLFNYIWREDIYDLAKLRTLIYRLKLKLGENPFESLYGQGYRINEVNTLV